MKKGILYVLVGALDILVTISVIATIHANKEQFYGDYDQIDFVSTITQDECYICGSTGNFAGFPYWGEDNIGIVNLNTFELLYLPINRYDEHGKLIEEAAGYMTSGGMSNEEIESYVHAFCFPDSSYADLQFSGVQYVVEGTSVQSHLCQVCLDIINNCEVPAEYAVISFKAQKIYPISDSQQRFLADNYDIDCEFSEDGKIDLFVQYSQTDASKE